MNVGAALRRGFDTLQRYPALLLFPLVWDVVQLGLHYWGVAAGPGWPAAQLGAQPGPNAIRGFVPSREAALALNTQSPFMFSPQPRTVVRVIPQPEGELVVSRSHRNMLGVAALRRGRFGWQYISSEAWGSEPSGGEPGVFNVTTQPDGGGHLYDSQWLIVGELFDDRIAYLQIGKERFPVGQDGPIFVIRPGFPPNPPFAWLDAAGQPVPVREVKAP